MVDVDHGDGVVTRYAHLSGAMVKEGSKLRRGDVVGRLGSTGRSTGPHLHYEVRVDNKAVNPEKMKLLREQLATLSKQLLEQL